MTTTNRARGPRRWFLPPRYQISVPCRIAGTTRTIRRHTLTRRSAMDDARRELAAAWTVYTDTRTVAKLARWDRSTNRYVVVGKWELVELDDEMKAVVR